MALKDVEERQSHRELKFHQQSFLKYQKNEYLRFFHNKRCSRSHCQTEKFLPARCGISSLILIFLFFPASDPSISAEICPAVFTGLPRDASSPELPQAKCLGLHTSLVFQREHHRVRPLLRIDVLYDLRCRHHGQLSDSPRCLRNTKPSDPLVHLQHVPWWALWIPDYLEVQPAHLPMWRHSITNLARS